MPAVDVIISGKKTTVAAVDHSLVATKLAALRARTTGVGLFRRNLREISMLLLVEASRRWETTALEIDTPLRKSVGKFLVRPVVFVPILRAGLGMVDGMVALLPEASIGRLGIYRDEQTLRPVSYFCRLPAGLGEAQVILADPMLATGNSACEAVATLKARGAQRIQFLCVISCPPGIERLQSSHPDVEIITAAVDPDLNDFGFILPGLGDAGDRYFDTG